MPAPQACPPPLLGTSLPAPPPACEVSGRGRGGGAHRGCTRSSRFSRRTRHRSCRRRAGPSFIRFEVCILGAVPAGAMMALEPLKSALTSNSSEDTSLALPSDNSLRTGHQRVKDQVHHSIKRSKSKQSRNDRTPPVSPIGVYRKPSNIT